MKVSRRNAVPYLLGGALTLATAIGVITYWAHLPVGGAFWGLDDLQSGTTRGSYSESQALPPEAEAVNSEMDKDGGDPRVTLFESTASAAAEKPAAAPETDAEITLLSAEAPLDGDSITDPGVAMIRT